MTKAWGMELPRFQFGLYHGYFHTIMESCDSHWIQSRGGEEKPRVILVLVFGNHCSESVCPPHHSPP